MSKQAKSSDPGPLRGQILFAIGFFVLSAFLLSQIGEQTKWVKGTKFFAQPRFWPAMGLSGMVLFGGLFLWRLPRFRPDRSDREEAVKWAKALEWVLWFMAYVYLVPLVGYLPVTFVFAIALCWRTGYRNARILGVSAGFAIAVVAVFKMWLDVKIPGAALYEYLPPVLRNFFILNF